MGDEMRLPARIVDRLRSRGGNRVGGRLERRGPYRQRPSPVFLNQDRNRLVSRGVEVLEHRRRRGERHFVLATAAAVDDPDADFFHGSRLSIDANFFTTEDTVDTEVRSYRILP